jgi:hypothetical protein
MKKQISSDTTAFWKYIFPGLWIPLVGIGAIAAGFQAANEPGWSLFVFGWIIASAYLIWFARRLKFVSIDEEFVYVSQFRNQIQIPLTHIERVKENFGARPKLITLTLNHPSEFGTEIVFVATPLVFTAFRSHPIVQEIERAVRHRRSSF